jgi:hypothetical protein
MVGGAASASAASSSSAAGCESRRSTTVEASDVARVFTKGARLYACLHKSGRNVLLGPGGRGCRDYCVDNLALAGRFVAFDRRSSTRSAVATAVFVADLRTRRVRALWRSGTLDGQTYTRVQSIVASRAGTAAWIWSYSAPGSGLPVTYEVRSSANGGMVLDSGSEIDAASLAIAGARVYWIKAGAPATALITDDQSA